MFLLNAILDQVSSGLTSKAVARSLRSDAGARFPDLGSPKEVAAVVACFLAGSRLMRVRAGDRLLRASAFDAEPLLGEENVSRLSRGMTKLAHCTCPELSRAARFYGQHGSNAVIPILRSMTWFAFFDQSLLVPPLWVWRGEELWFECVRARTALKDPDLLRDVEEAISRIPTLFRVSVHRTTEEILEDIARRRSLLS